MAKKEVKLENIPMSQVTKFKIKNRKGFAIVCKNNLTEGKTVDEGIARMNKALKREGYTIG